jgi:hypothetical protein
MPSKRAVRGARVARWICELADCERRPRSVNMADPVTTPFAALSLTVAPAILTNASSVLAMSTSNRLARAVDRGRELARQLEGGAHTDGDGRRLNELAVTEDRAILLVRALRSFYTALGAFAVATLVSLVGAVAATAAGGVAVKTMEVVALIAGAIAVAALVHGSLLLLRETSRAVDIMREGTRLLRRHRGRAA